MVDRILATNGVQPTFSVRPHFLASSLTVELPAYVRTNNLHVPGTQKTKPGSQNTIQDKQEGSSCPWERKDDNQWVSKNQIHKNLNLERKGQYEILSSFLNQALHRSRTVDSGKNSHPLLALPVFLGSHLQALEQVG